MEPGTSPPLARRPRLGSNADISPPNRQAGPAVQNIMCLIETDAANAALPPGAPLESPKLVEYERSPPQIKLTLGLGHSVSELLPSMDAKETVIKTASDGPVDGHWKVMWEGMGADPSDVNA